MRSLTPKVIKNVSFHNQNRNISSNTHNNSFKNSDINYTRNLTTDINDMSNINKQSKQNKKYYNKDTNRFIKEVINDFQANKT